jgi:hypothetical protein
MKVRMCELNFDWTRLQEAISNMDHVLSPGYIPMSQPVLGGPLFLEPKADG